MPSSRDDLTSTRVATFKITQMREKDSERVGYFKLGMDGKQSRKEPFFLFLQLLVYPSIHALSISHLILSVLPPSVSPRI